MTILLPTPVEQDRWPQARWPLGAALDPGSDTATFAVHAPVAERVRLELFGAHLGSDPYFTTDLARGDDGIWRARLAHVGAGVHYGFRCWGPNWPSVDAWQPGGSDAGFGADVDADGNRFNPNKLLFDPYAREVSHTTASSLLVDAGWDAGMFGTGAEDYRGAPRRNFDTARWAPKGIIVADRTGTGTRPRIPPQDSMIYEAHVKGLTAHPSSVRLGDLLAGHPEFASCTGVPDELRGTYAGAAHLAPYLKALGCTTIELLPVHQSNDSDSGDRPGYWGYATLAFFAPNRSYAHDQTPGGPTAEFKQMVAAFHAWGLEVYLDVVYNHSGEGGNWGGRPDTTGFTSLGGFDAPGYYVLTRDNRLVDGATGVSNQINYSTPAAVALVVDSLTYWTDVMGVDGFRFDLAPVLGREPGASARDDWPAQRRFFNDHPLLVQIRDLAASRQIEVIAEAWDLWGYEVGQFPAGWGEWNGRFRDAVRHFGKGDANTYSFIDQMNGNYNDFNDQGGPQRSINFVTAHDGFTLADLVSYDSKQNGQGWPFGPSDGGTDDNLSWGSGGDKVLRRQRLRSFWVLLVLSRGVPMLVAGDEFGRTQNGNNNPYAIDSVGMWLNWDMIGTNAPQQVPVDPDHPDYRYHDNLGQANSPVGVNPLFVLADYLMTLRQAHPALRQHAYGNLVVGDDDVSYLFSTPQGRPPGNDDRAVRLLIDCDATGSGDLLVMINMTPDPVDFQVPRPAAGRPWRKIVDTASYAEANANVWAPETADVVQGDYRAAGWSVAVLLEVGATDRTPVRRAGDVIAGALTDLVDRLLGRRR